MAHPGLWKGWKFVPGVALASACATPAIPVDAQPPTALAIASEPFLVPAAVPLPGEQLTYGIALAGFPVGEATLTTRFDGTRFEFEVAGESNAIVALLYDVQGIARTRLREDGRSQSFYLRMEEDGKTSERALAYGEVPSLCYRPWNEEGWAATLTQYKDPRDPLSLLLEVRKLEPSSDPRDFEVAMTLRSFCYRANYLGRGDVRVDAGEFRDAMFWRVEVRPFIHFGDSLDVGPMVGFYDLALSADERRLPLRVSREFGFGRIALELENVAIARPFADDFATVTIAAGESDAAGQ